MMCLPRVAFVLGVAVTSVSCGGTDLEGGRSRTPLGPSPIPDNAPQQVVTGFVRNTVSELIAGAQVSIVGTSLSTVTDAAGRYDLRGNIDIVATVQVAKDGYISQTREVTLTACPGATPCLQAQATFVLHTVAGPSVVSGEYLARIEADPTCPDLPSEARARTYTASITPASPDNANLEVTIGGASLYVDGWNVFYAGVAGDRFVLRLEGSWVAQAFMEEVAPNTYVGFHGIAAATVPPGASTISAALDGSITYCRTQVRLTEPFYGCVDALGRTGCAPAGDLRGVPVEEPSDGLHSPMMGSRCPVPRVGDIDWSVADRHDLAPCRAFTRA